MNDIKKAIYAAPPIQTPQEVRTTILKVIKERRIKALSEANGVKK